MDRMIYNLETSEWVWYLVPIQFSNFIAYRIFDRLSRLSSSFILYAVSLLFIFQLILLYAFKEQLQYSSAYLTLYLRNYSNPAIDGLSDFIHHRISTGNWLLLCCSLMWLFPSNERWYRLYCFSGVGFVVKSLMKSFINCPRGFWLWTMEISAPYCGRGWSLPSGHSMVSLCVLSFLVKELQTPIMFWLTVFVEILTFLNVTYIGTHTYADVIVGWTGALLCLAVFVWMEDQVFPVLKKRMGNTLLSYSMILFAIGAIVITADFIEVHSHPDVLPKEWQINMERVCGFAQNSAESRMRLRLQWTNVPLIMGIAIGFSLHQAYFQPSTHLKGPILKVILCLGGGYIFVNLFSWCKQLVNLSGVPATWATYIHNFMSPLVVQFLWPSSVILARNLTCGVSPDSLKKSALVSSLPVKNLSVLVVLLSIGYYAISSY